MAEEDLIFGKNRHFFGGIEPSNMLAFSAVFVAQYGGVMIAATLPNDTVVNNQTLLSGICTLWNALSSSFLSVFNGFRRRSTGPMPRF